VWSSVPVVVVVDSSGGCWWSMSIVSLWVAVVGLGRRGIGCTVEPEEWCGHFGGDVVICVGIVLSVGLGSVVLARR
jgi:hypothetical protein